VELILDALEIARVKTKAQLAPDERFPRSTMAVSLFGENEAERALASGRKGKKVLVGKSRGPGGGDPGHPRTGHMR